MTSSARNIRFASKGLAAPAGMKRRRPKLSSVPGTAAPESSAATLTAEMLRVQAFVPAPYEPDPAQLQLAPEPAAKFPAPEEPPRPAVEAPPPSPADTDLKFAPAAAPEVPVAQPAEDAPVEAPAAPGRSEPAPEVEILYHPDQIEILPPGASIDRTLHLVAPSEQAYRRRAKLRVAGFAVAGIAVALLAMAVFWPRSPSVETFRVRSIAPPTAATVEIDDKIVEIDEGSSEAPGQAPQVNADPPHMIAAIAPGYFVQVATVSSRTLARLEWTRLQRINPELAGLQVKIVGANNRWRLRVGPYADRAAAGKLCEILEGRGQDCLLFRP
jgi:SPOR domain